VSRGCRRVAAKLAEYANAPALGPEQFMALNFAFEALRRGIEDATPEAVRSSIVEAMELLGFEPLELSVKDLRSSRPSGSPTSVQALGSLDGSRTSHEEESSGMIGLKRAAETLGGKLDTSFGAGGELFRLEFPAAALEKSNFFFSPFDPDEDFSHVLPSQDERSNKILKSIKEFMASLPREIWNMLSRFWRTWPDFKARMNYTRKSAPWLVSFTIPSEIFPRP